MACSLRAAHTCDGVPDGQLRLRLHGRQTLLHTLQLRLQRLCVRQAAGLPPLALLQQLRDVPPVFQCLQSCNTTSATDGDRMG